MVSVKEKAVTQRCAIASARLSFSAGSAGAKAAQLLASNAIAKGDALTVAHIAGIQGAKMTSLLIPLSHPVPLSQVALSFRMMKSPGTDQVEAVEVRARAEAEWKTGVEMEALTACAVAALTLYDMCKAVDKGMTIGQLQLEHKSGGRSGTYDRTPGEV